MKIEKVNWVPLFDVCRGSLVERTIYGALSIFQKSNSLTGREAENINFAGINPLVFGRSLMKPFQMKPIVSDLDQHFGWEAKALSIASHSGEEKHHQFLSVMKSLFDKEDSLRVPESLPMQVAAFKNEKSKLSHPCSGKHLAILHACKERGWKKSNYLNPEHEYNQLYFQYLMRMLTDYDLALGLIDRNKDSLFSFHDNQADGCGLPTVGLQLSELAYLFCHLAETAEKDWIWEAAHRYPELVGGTGRVDSLIMKSHPFVFAKEGADGLLGISIASSSKSGGVTTGIVLKLAAGYDLNVLWILAEFILENLGFALLPPSPLPGQQIWFNKDLQNFLSEVVIPID